MKRIIFTLLLIISAIYTYAQSPGEGKKLYVTSRYLNIRSEPSTTSEIEHRLEFTDDVELIGSYNSEWKLVRVYFLNTKTSKMKVITGYAASKHLDDAPPEYDKNYLMNMPLGASIMDYKYSTRKKKN